MSEDDWWSEECRLDEDHAACDLTGCDCSCHHLALTPGIQATGVGGYRVSATVSPTTGLYITGQTDH